MAFQPKPGKVPTENQAVTCYHIVHTEGAPQSFFVLAEQFFLGQSLSRIHNKNGFEESVVCKSQSMIVLVLKSFYNTDKDKYPTYLLINQTNGKADLFTSLQHKPKLHAPECVRKNSLQHFKLQYAVISISKSTSLQSEIFGLL